VPNFLGCVGAHRGGREKRKRARVAPELGEKKDKKKSAALVIVRFAASRVLGATMRVISERFCKHGPKTLAQIQAQGIP
jgi:hypothetical protein